MKILFDLLHPAHVHLFKNLIFHLKADSKHEVFITSRDKDVTSALLDNYKLAHTPLSKAGVNLTQFGYELIKRDLNIYKMHLKHKLDLAFGTSPSIAHLSLVSSVRSYILEEDDDDIVPLFVNISYPFATGIIVPDNLRYQKWDKKRIKHNSYHELAYLHPNNFKPDINVLKKYELEPFKYIIFRKSALTAHHDKGIKGFDNELLKKIDHLIKDYRIISSKEKEKKNEIAPWDFHHVLAFARMLISDSQTMTAEASVLGIPNIRYNSFVGKLSYLEELEHKFDLTKGYLPGEESKLIAGLEQLINENDYREVWDKKKETMLKQKCDLNKWLIDFVINL